MAPVRTTRRPKVRLRVVLSGRTGSGLATGAARTVGGR
jgi:hypothetical protein